MDLYVTLGLLLVVSIAVNASGVSEYIPKITQNITFNITDKTFVLDQPNCIFNTFTRTNVWVVIALNQSFSALNDSDFGTPVPYSAYKNGSSEYYHTLLVSAGKYPCSNSQPASDKLIQIGATSSCASIQFCNGELNNNYTYRVRFVLLDNMGVYNKTQWSEEIKLQKVIPFQGSIFWSSGRSGGMIVLTSILSVLLAILLVCFIAALTIGSKNIYWKRSMILKSNTDSKMDFMTRSTYSSRYDHMHLVT
ncbi:uroplakin-3b-like [Anomaloglossus baeobatrachus]|uniref:uroplakin-3b-like n=1 Tax=Anomaloglossus baeobatrachus TaxID=238106 RepID=UPI003F4F500E